MPLLILALIIAVPIMEFTILVDVGGQIGALTTVALCLLTASVGLTLVRAQGLKVMRDMQAAAHRGEPIGASLVHGFFLLVAGVFLFIPGFVTDFFGAILLIPPVRLMLARAGFAHFMMRRGQAGPGQTTIIIDGEIIQPDRQPEARARNTVLIDQTPEPAPAPEKDTKN